MRTRFSHLPVPILTPVALAVLAWPVALLAQTPEAAAAPASDDATYRVVVTGAGTGAGQPLTVVTDPRQARQPIPA